MKSAPSPENVKAALFDVDGTLVDSMQKLVNGLGDAVESFMGERPSESQLRSTMGMSLRAQLEHFLGRLPSSDEQERFGRIAIESYESHKDLESTFPEAVQALEACFRAGLKTCLVTSKNSEELALFLHRFSHAQYITDTVCASDVSQPKPSPESAFLACGRLGVSTSEAVLIGDSVFDLQCAKGAGVFSVAVAYGASSFFDLERHEPDVLLRTPADLWRWVNEALLTQPCHAKK